MLIGDGDRELNLLQGFDKSLPNVLAQTMDGQDKIFRNQVVELHRLYHIQKTLMQEMDQKVCSQFNSRQDSPNSFVGAFVVPNWHRKEKYSNLHAKTYEGQFLQDSTSTCLKPEQRPINMELPVSLNTNLNGDVLYEKCTHITTRDFVKMKCELCNVKASPTEELELSLSINTETRKTCCAEKFREDQIICSPSTHYMNPKSSTDSDGDLVAITSLEHSAFSDYQLNFEQCSCTRSRKNDGFYQDSRINSLTDVSTDFLDEKPAIQVVEQCNDDLPCKVKSTRRRLLTSDEVVELDLNRALPEEMSFNSIGHLISYSSNCTFSSLDRNEQEIKCSNDSDQQEMMDTWTTSPSKDTSDVNCGSPFGSVDLHSICEPPSKSGKPGCCTRSYRPENTAFQLILPHRSCQAISMDEVNAEKHKECVLYSHDSSQELADGVRSNRFPISSKSDSTPEDISTNLKKGECGVNMESSPTRFQDRKPSIPATKLYQQNTIASLKHKRKFQASNKKYDELPEVDISIKNGAVSLLYLSSVCSDKNQDYVPCSIRRREISNVARGVRQCSSESYESIVLKQPEISLDEYSVTSTPSEVNCSNEKNYGIKLKRGRRMKDFRKEILPGLASLSRQEICEDVRIMRRAIRSLEYKHRSKMRGISDCFSPLKSNRSRHGHGRRRGYS